MRAVIIIYMSFVVTQVCAQNKQLLYNVDDLPQTLLSNPGASIAFEKHIGVPFLSGFSVSAGSSGVSTYDIFQEGGDINTRIRDAIFRLDNKDSFVVNQQLELVSFGWKSKFTENYYSAGLYQETDVIAYFPKDIAILAYEGNANFIDVPFQFSDISVAAEVISVYHFGVNKEISKKLRVGGRAKLYMSIVNINSTDNEGVFITRSTPNGPNFLQHQVQGANVTANTSGLRSFVDDNAGAGKAVGRAILSNNLGVGFDIGATYTIDDHWTATGSIIDVGAIFHTKDLKNYRLSGSYETDGIELQFPDVLNGEDLTDYWQNLQDEFEENLPYEDSLQASYTTWRPTKFNASINRGFGTNLNGDCDCTNSGVDRYATNVGAQLYAIKRPRGFQGAATLYVDRTWNRFLRTKMTYTYDAFSNRNIGLLLSTKINKFNVYLAADNILDYTNLAKAQSASVQFGFQLIFDPE